MPTETQLTITNAALAQTGARSSLASVDENSNEAKQAASIFGKTVREVLALVPWDFATTTVVPAAVTPPTGGVLPGWAYIYQRPADALLLQQMFDSGGTANSSVPIFPGAIGQSFVRGGKVRYATGWLGGLRIIYTNTSSPTLQYTALVQDFDQWSPNGIALLVITLAAKLAFPLSGDKTLRDRLKQEQLQLEERARVMSANESVDLQDYPAAWILAREASELQLGNPQDGFWADGAFVAYGS